MADTEESEETQDYEIGFKVPASGTAHGLLCGALAACRALKERHRNPRHIVV